MIFSLGVGIGNPDSVEFPRPSLHFSTPQEALDYSIANGPTREADLIFREDKDSPLAKRYFEEVIGDLYDEPMEYEEPEYEDNNYFCEVINKELEYWKNNPDQSR